MQTQDHDSHAGGYIHDLQYQFDDLAISYAFTDPVPSVWKKYRFEQVFETLEQFGLEFYELRDDLTADIVIDLADPLAERRETVLGVADPEAGLLRMSDRFQFFSGDLYETVATHEVLHMLGFFEHADPAEGRSILETGLTEENDRLTARDIETLEAWFPYQGFDRQAARKLEFDATRASDNATAEEIVEDAYWWALDRAPDAAGAAFWEDQVERGVDIEPYFAAYVEAQEPQISGPDWVDLFFG